MYRCEHCGSNFKIPGKVIEPDGLDTPPYRTTNVCPLCGSEDYYNYIGSCDCCGTWMSDWDTYYVTADNRMYCSGCITER